MKNNVKVSAFAGTILFVLAALFSISLLLVLFDFGGSNFIYDTFFYKLGKMFVDVYGICSGLIPLFLLVAAIQCFTTNWSVKRGIILLGSIVPFFTLDAIEHVCRMIIDANTGDVLAMKLVTTFLIGGIVVTIEYLVLSLIGNYVEYKESAFEIEEETDEIQVEEINEPIFLNDSSEENINIESESIDLYDDEKNYDNELSESTVEEENPFAHIFDEQEEKSVEESLDDETELNEFNYDKVEDVVEEDFETSVFEDNQNDQTIINLNENDEDFIDSDESDIDIKEFNEDEYIDDNENSLNIDDIDIIDSFADEDEYYKENDLSDALENNENDGFDSFEDAEELDFAEDIGEESTDYNYESVDNLTEEIEDSVDDEDKVIEFLDLMKDKSISTTSEKNSALNNFELEEPKPENENIIDVIDFFDDEKDNIEEELPSDFFEENIENEESTQIENNFTQNDEESNEVKEYVEGRISRFENIFAQMDEDVKKNPFAVIEDFDDDNFVEDLESGISEELDKDYSVDDYEFDPTASPVVDSNGVPYETSIPLNMDDISFEKISEAKKKTLNVSQKKEVLTGSEAILSSNEEIEKPKPKLKISNYKIPTEGLLSDYPNGEYWIIDQETKDAAQDLKDTLNEFKIEAEVTGIRKGPVVTMFEILPAPGVKLSKIVALQDNIALRLAASSVRIVAPIPGKHAVGIEVPNKDRAIVSFKEIIDKKIPEFEKMAIPVVLGKDISGEPQVLDLAKTPHLLIAGSTGAGKSVCVNSMLLSILYKRNPQQVKLVLIDPKIVELKLYNDIPHLLSPVITEPKRALQALQYCLSEMERRYALLDGMGVRDISSYNRRIAERKIMQEKLPYIVVIIDEFADLMATTGKELESTIARLAAMSRAVGIHLVLATQRPSIDVITGLIKANIPSRIAFMVASKMDSRIIIDQVGAEKLLGKGDMLYASATDPFPVRIQGTLVSDDEVERVVEYVKQYGEPEYIDDEMFVDDEDDEGINPGLFSDGEDPLYDQALQIVVQAGKASASYIQRRLKIGYNRAARLVEEMEERGIVGPQNGSKPREIIHIP